MNNTQPIKSKRFSSISALIWNFYHKTYDAGHTGQRCSNYATDFKKDWKYKFVDNVYYEEGKPQIYINPHLKIAIHIVEYNPHVLCWSLKGYKRNGYIHLHIRDEKYVRDFLKDHINNISDFISSIMFLATVNYVEATYHAKRMLQYGRQNTHGFTTRYLAARDNYQKIRTYCNRIIKKYNIDKQVLFIYNAIWVEWYKGWRKCCDKIDFGGIDAWKADKTYYINKKEFITLAAKSWYYDRARKYTIDKRFNYKQCIAYYNTIGRLKQAYEQYVTYYENRFGKDNCKYLFDDYLLLKVQKSKSEF